MSWDSWVALLGMPPADVQTVATAIIACGAIAMVLVQGLKGVLSSVWRISLSATAAQVLSFAMAIAMAAPTLARYRASPLLLALGVALAAVSGPLWHDLMRKLKPATSTATT